MRRSLEEAAPNCEDDRRTKAACIKGDIVTPDQGVSDTLRAEMGGLANQGARPCDKVQPHQTLWPVLAACTAHWSHQCNTSPERWPTAGLPLTESHHAPQEL